MGYKFKNPQIGRINLIIVTQTKENQMPLQMASELRFPMGNTIPLCDGAVDDFLLLIKRVSTPIGSKQTIEIFKQHFCKVSGDCYSSSSSLDWAESDMRMQAQNASIDAPNFIAAVYDSLEELGSRGATVPTILNINKILLQNQIQYEIIGDQLLETGSRVATPVISESVSTTVMRALGDAKALIGTVDASSAIDRAHTALHGYLVQLCHDSSIMLPNDPTASKG